MKFVDLIHYEENLGVSSPYLRFDGIIQIDAGLWLHCSDHPELGVISTCTFD